MGNNCSRQTSIAAVPMPGESYRAYFQDKSGNILEAIHKDGEWTGGEGNNAVIATAKLGSGIAAVQYGNGTQIRVYFVDNDDVLQEMCWSGQNWYTTDSLKSLKIKCGPKSALAAEWWEAQGQLGVWYIDQNNCIRRVTHRGQWEVDKRDYGSPVIGSAFALNSFDIAPGQAGPAHFVYLWYQDASSALSLAPLYETADTAVHSDSDNVAELKAAHGGGVVYPAGISSGGMAAINWNNKLDAVQDPRHIQLYWQDVSGSLKEARILKNFWSTDSTLRAPVVENTTMAPYFGVYRTNLAAVLMEDGKRVRLIYQGSYDRICEMRNDGAGWLDMGPITPI